MARILIADDDPDICLLLWHFLRADHHEVEVVGDGARALARAYIQPPDLFLCDLCMPGMSGLEAIRLVRAAFPEVPVVAVSGGILGDQGEEPARHAGAHRVLAKPFDLSALSALVGELLGQESAARAGC